MSDYFESRKKLERTIKDKLPNDGDLSDSFIEKIFTVSGQFRLTLGEIGGILELVNKVVENQIHREQFFENLQKVVNLEAITLTDDEIRQIATMVDDEVLTPLQRQISRMSEKINQQKRLETIRADLWQNAPLGRPPAERVGARFVQPPPTPPREAAPFEDRSIRLDTAVVPEFGQANRPDDWPARNNAPRTTAVQGPTDRVAPAGRAGWRFATTLAEENGEPLDNLRGDIGGGVEIEKSDEPAEEDGMEGLDRTRLLEEIEHPPRYDTSLEQKLNRVQEAVPPPPPPTQPAPPTDKQPEKPGPEQFGKTDPYREPV